MVVRGNIDKDYFADGRPDLVENGVEIDVEAIARALVNIYQERIDIEHDIDDGLYRETLRIIKDAVDNGYADAIEAGTPAPDEEFRDAFEHSAEVFSAFRVHRMQNDIAAQMIDSSGKVKPFREFVRDVSSYIDHQNRAWLQTEYNTAILRAQNAAEWKQFQEEKDVYPNLEWIRSTSPNPGADHVPFWGTVLPVDDPFWDEHKPGDRWNCKCELRQTDKHSTAVPHSDGSSDAARGLESNPAKAREVFSDRHPYYPSSCVSCPFSGNKLLALFHDLAGGKHCHSCQYVNRCIEAAEHSDGEPAIKVLKQFKSGGVLEEYQSIEHGRSDYNHVKRIGRLFAEAGEHVTMLPRVHSKDPVYDKIYGALRGTKYENKCPDLKIGGAFYEIESYVKPWKKKKVGRMLSHGLDQSDRIIIDNSKGCSHRYLKKVIGTRMRIDTITEVWLYESGKVIPFVLKGKFVKPH